MAPRTSPRKKTTTVKMSQKTKAKQAVLKQKKAADKRAVKKLVKDAVKAVMKNAAKQRQYFVKDDEDSSAPCRVDEILDSRPGPDGTLFLVRFAGDNTSGSNWIKENELGSRELLWKYHSSLQRQTSAADPDGMQSSPRARASKTRAKLLLQHAISFDEQLVVPSKKPSSAKRAKRSMDDSSDSNERTPAKASKRRTNKAAMDEALKQERAQHEQYFRSALANFTPAVNEPHKTCLDCCATCSSREYHRAIKSKDSSLLSNLCEDTKSVPNWTEDQNPDTPFCLPLTAAFLSGRTEFVEMLLKADNNPRGPPIKSSEEFSTGRVSRMAFGAFSKTVNESRGNRKGNQAFYSKPGRPALEVQYSKTWTMNEAHNKAVLAVVRDPSLSPEMIDYMHLKDHMSNLAFFAWALYEAVAAGNRSVAASIADVINEAGGLNKVHQEVLKLNGIKPLTQFRRNQILKKASENFTLTPVECAAIHPKRKYLEELFEHLDDLGQGHTDAMGRTVAHFAAASETTDCLEYLLSKGFNCMQLDKYKMTPLLLAAKYGRSHNVELLLNTLQAKANDESTTVADSTMLPQKWTALHYASYYGSAETCKLLISRGANTRYQDSVTKHTPLHFAATQGHIDCMKALIEEGMVDVNIVDKFGSTPLHLACQNGQYESVVTLLSYGANPSAGDTSGNCPLHYAAAYGWLNIVQLLMETTECDPNPSNLWKTTPCGIADRKGHTKVVRYFLGNKTKKIDVNFKDNEGKTLLHHCVGESYTSKYEAEKAIAKAKHLIASGADPNARDVEENTPLHQLANVADFKMERQLGYEIEDENLINLVRVGFNRNFYTSTFNQKPQSTKVEYDDLDGVAAQKEMVKLLVKAGADTELQEFSGNTPLATAMSNENDHIIEALLENGASPLSTTSSGKSIFHYLLAASRTLDNFTVLEGELARKERKKARLGNIWKLLLKNSKAILADLCDLANKIDDAGYSPLLWGIHQAIQYQLNSVRVTKEKIKNNYNGWSRATAPEQRKICDFRYHFDEWISSATTFVNNFKPNMNAVRELEKGFLENNPKAKPSEYPPHTGRGPLHYACSIHHPSLVGFLLNNGADANLESGPLDDHKTPIMFCANLTPENNDHVPNVTTETLEKLKAQYDIHYPDFPDQWLQSNSQLLMCGAQPYQTDAKQVSAAMTAAHPNHPNVLLEMLTMAEMNEITIGINNTNESQNSLLMVVVKAFSETFNFKKAERNDYLKAISSLLRQGSDPNLRNRKQLSALMIAAQHSVTKIVHTLVTKSILPLDYSLCNENDENALIIACKGKERELITLILNAMTRNRPDVVTAVNQTDKWSKSPLSIVATLGLPEIIELLLNHGANPNNHGTEEIPIINAIKTKCFASVQHLINAHANVNAVDKSGQSALHYAVKGEKANIVKLLLEAGADVNAKNKHNQTPLHFAIQCSKVQVNTSLRVEKLLLDFGADINAADNLGRTPLHTVFVDLGYVPDMRFIRPIRKRVEKSQRKIHAKKKLAQTIEAFVNKYSSDDTRSWFYDGKRLEMEKSVKNEEQAEDDKIVDFATDEELRLFDSANWEDSDKRQVTKSDRVDIIGFLLHYPKISLDLRDVLGRSSLHYAASVGAFTCTTQLLERSVDLNALDNDNNMPVNMALIYDHVDYAVMMSQRGALLRSDIHLADGKSVSIFEYSLSKSFLNLGYFMIEKDISPQQYVHDALKTGKFHVSSLLLNSAAPSMLNSVNDQNQTFFHIICSFSPFDQAAYDEYGEEFFNILLQSNVDPSTVDSYGRTPIHWACKYNQLSLLKKLLQLGKIKLDTSDYEGKSEVWLAVEANSVEAVMLLLDNGASVNSSSIASLPVILLATRQGNLELVKLLIQYGCLLDNDSCQDRANAVMQAVIDQRADILEALLCAGSSPNTPSLYISNNKKCYVLQPILVSCTKPKDKIFQLLLQYKADVDITAPEDCSLKGRTPLMHNLKIGNYERSKLLFQHQANINLIDPNTNRTVFYTYLLDEVDNHMLEFMWKLQPNVDIVDEITGQTLLEFAIRKNYQDLLKRLLELNASRNTLSCQKQDKAIQNYFDPVPALFHAVLGNNYEAVEILLAHPTNGDPIDWTFKDQSGRNVIARTVQCFETSSYENDSILRLLVKSCGNLAKKLLNDRDHDGKRAIDHATEYASKVMYNTLIELGSNPPSKVAHEAADMEVEYEYHRMPVEQDAAQARQLLLQQAEAERIRKGEVETKNKAEVDPLSQLVDVGEVVYHNGEPLDIIIHKTDVLASRWGTNMFYKMSLIHNKILDLDILWTRWGALGEDGAYQKTPVPGRDAAVAEFEKIFKAKTGNLWATKNSSFEPKPGKYNMVKQSPYTKDTILAALDTSKAPVPSQLSTSVQDCLRLCLDFKHLKNAQAESQMDLPLGNLSQDTLEKAHFILRDIDQILVDLEVQSVAVGGAHNVPKMKELYHKIALLSNEYYLLVPNSSHARRGIVPLNSRDNLSSEQSRLSNLRYFNYTANVLLAAQHRSSDLHPLDYVYKSLNCNIQELSPDNGHEDIYNMVAKYMQGTGGGPTGENYDLLHLFSLEREGEASRFKPFATNENRMLLWHGSKISNFIGILKQGLRIKPAQANESGSMFGTGLYFADMFSKSSGYCNDYTSVDAQPYSLLFLCEVALGKTYDLVDSKFMERPEENHLSTKGLGRFGPDPKMQLHDKQGLIIPQGPVQQQRDEPAAPMFGQFRPTLMHNEYIVYDPAQVRMKYLLVVQNNSYCPVCSQAQPSKSIKRLQDYEFDQKNYAHTMKRCNEYESTLINMQMLHQGTNTEEIYKQGIERYLEILQTGEYGADKLTAAMRLKKSSKVCQRCALDIKDRMLIYWYKTESNRVPAEVRDREDCKWGYECRTQHAKLDHAKRLNHLCVKTAE